MSHFAAAPQFIVCPDENCGTIAEITDRFELASTDGPLAHVETCCARRHVFRLPADRIRFGIDHRQSVTPSYAHRQDG
jgi:hypothetical protein